MSKKHLIKNVCPNCGSTIFLLSLWRELRRKSGNSYCPVCDCEIKCVIVKKCWFVIASLTCFLFMMCTFYFIEYIFERKDICVTLMAISMFIWMMALQFFVFYAQFMYFVAADNLDTSDSKENIAPRSAAGVGVDSVFESSFEAGRHLDKPKIIERYLLSK